MYNILKTLNAQNWSQVKVRNTYVDCLWSLKITLYWSTYEILHYFPKQFDTMKARSGTFISGR